MATAEVLPEAKRFERDLNPGYARVFSIYSANPDRDTAPIGFRHKPYFFNTRFLLIVIWLIVFGLNVIWVERHLAVRHKLANFHRRFDKLMALRKKQRFRYNFWNTNH